MQHHPHQLLNVSTCDSLLVTASGPHVFLFSLDSKVLVASSSAIDGAHKSFIRFACTYTDASTGLNYAVSTGEDKLLIVWSLPSLEIMSSRELSKRANAMCINPKNGDIVIGDKFGDIFVYDLLPPAPTMSDAGQLDPKPSPIAGHVSMLTSLVLIPQHPPLLPHDLVVSGDRDEHVRLSRYHSAHIIERFLFGNTRFVSALLYLEPTPATPHPVLLTAGASADLFAFDPSTGTLLVKISITALFAYLVVDPERAVAVDHGLKKKLERNTAKKAKDGKGKGREVDAEVGADAAQQDGWEEEDGGVTTEPAEGDENQMDSVVGTPAGAEGDGEGSIAGSIEEGNKKGLAANRIVSVGDRATGGVIVVSAGATAVLFIPFSQIYSPAPASADVAPPILLDLHHPVLDVFATAPGSSMLWISLDLSRGREVTDGVSQRSVRRIILEDGQLSLAANDDSLQTFETLITTTSVPVSECCPPPSVGSLYPELALLHNPEDFSYEEPISANNAKRFRPDPATKSETIVFDHQTSSEARGRTGRRAAGRAKITAKFESAKLLAELAGSTAGGSGTPRSVEDETM